MSNWRSWCRLCGNCELDTLQADQEMTGFVAECFGIYLNNCQICIDCHAYIEDMQHFLERANQVKKLIEQIESLDETKLSARMIRKLRLSYHLKVSDVQNDEEEIDEIVESFQEIQSYEFADDDEHETETTTNDPVISMSMMEEDFLEADDSFLFELTNETSSRTLIEQTSSSQIFKKSNLKKFRCEQCGKAFKEARHLTTHEQSHLPNDLKLTQQCPHCDKMYSSVFSVRNHIRHVHIKKPEFRCQFCKKEFSRKANLDSHLSHVHTRDRKFECEICGLKVKTKGILRTHKLLHSNNPADVKKCTECPKHFKTQNQLTNHMKRHSKAKEEKTKE